jgi:sugar lactone lactonase YvrE
MIFEPLLDFFRGKAITIPPMDGPLRPNTALDEAAVVRQAAAPDNLCFDGKQILYSSGTEVLALTGDAPLTIASYDSPVAALAVSPGGELTVALDDGRLMVGERTLPAPGGLASLTALAFGDGDTLFLCQGSARHRSSDWVVDLMERNATGSVWRLDLRSGEALCLARDLAFPYGLLVESGGSLVVAESWRHRLLRLPQAGGAATPILAKLPGYPARLAPAGDGGAWLTLFAPRNRLIEFVLEEESYRADMMREVPRDCWIAPSLSSGASFLEPLQCGGVKTMGIHKPWSPSRSYGLVVRLDAAMRPVTSFHSRTNGHRHGVTSAVEAGGRVLVSSKGGGAILDIAGVQS